MKELQVRNFGPLGDVDVRFGDLTILVGPQAGGKSIFLELLKLIIDRENIISDLDRYNYLWGCQVRKILDVYFGEGMGGIWSADSEISLDGNSVQQSAISGKAEAADETLFYIPAQRILSISDGRPKNFMEFDNSTPYVLRKFSETLRLFMQNGIGDDVFPLHNRLKPFLLRSFDRNIFHQGKIVMEENAGLKKMRMNTGGMSIPFMAWSAGQKEFMPLLLAFYCLSGPPSKVVKREKYKYVVLEEPEMGLHPQAVISVILQVVELMQNGYQVLLSTHSSVLLEFAWAFQLLKKTDRKQQDKALNEVFDIHGHRPTSGIPEGFVSGKSIRTYFFRREENGRVVSHDISALDAANTDGFEADWGGVSKFASHVSDVVSKYMMES